MQSILDGIQSPLCPARPDQYMHFMLISQKTFGQIRPNKPRRARNDYALHVWRVATSTQTAQASAFTTGRRSTTGSRTFITFANESGENIGTNPA